MTPDEQITDARHRVGQAQDRLWRLLADACPGPHEFIQHRDRRPPWCGACGRTVDGVAIEAGR